MDLKVYIGPNCTHRYPQEANSTFIDTCPSPKNKASAQNPFSHQLRSQRIYPRAEDVGEATLTFYQALKCCFRRAFATFTNWSKHEKKKKKKTHTQKIPSQSLPTPTHKLMTDRRISKKLFLTPQWQDFRSLSAFRQKKTPQSQRPSFQSSPETTGMTTTITTCPESYWR